MQNEFDFKDQGLYKSLF